MILLVLEQFTTTTKLEWEDTKIVLYWQKNYRKASQLKCSFNKITKLSDELFYTGDIQTIDYCLEVYRQYVNNENFDPFLHNDWEIKQTLSVLLELIKFNKHTIEFF